MKITIWTLAQSTEDGDTVSVFPSREEADAVRRAALAAAWNFDDPMPDDLDDAHQQIQDEVGYLDYHLIAEHQVELSTVGLVLEELAAAAEPMVALLDDMERRSSAYQGPLLVPMSNLRRLRLAASQAVAIAQK